MKRSFPILVAAVAVAATAMAAAGCTDRNETRNTEAVDQAQVDPVMTTLDDNRIVAAVRSDYFAADQVKSRDIDVSSDQGTVTLAGTVPSEAVHQQAVSLARNVTGVKDVHDRLRVQADTSSSTDTAANRTTDDAAPAWVTTKILAEYYVNPQLKPWNIDVSTSQDGVVTLEGRIDNDQDRAKAVSIAQSTAGVTDVRDRLRAGDVAATSGTADAAGAAGVDNDLSDGWISTKIQARYFVDPDVKGREINVDTKDGVVVLRGTVGSYSARRQAVNAARSTDGVREVRDELRVDVTGSGESAAVRTRTDDGWITTKIQSKFFLDGDVQGSGIDITAKNGVVTLTGRVASKSAKDTALQLAKDTDGVRSVRDRLTVDSTASTAGTKS